ncbi:unnamed protein product [Merluccius merluccius]
MGKRSLANKTDELAALVKDQSEYRVQKLDAILENPDHSLYDELVEMRSTFSHRLIPPRHTTKCLVQSFLLVVIGLHNQGLSLI